jgi:hypothetical protein|tara:strand:- start:1407 stop:1694 length:288 start_codon:yes stop_codon:yes gene_type:complete
MSDFLERGMSPKVDRTLLKNNWQEIFGRQITEKEKTMYKDIFKEEVVDAVMIEELDVAIELAEVESDDVLLEALHKVRAYFSVPGTYLEGKHDGE